MTTVWVLRSKELDFFGQQVLVTIFPFFNFYNFSNSTNNVGHIEMVFIQKIVLRKKYMYIEKMQLWTIFLPYKKCVTEKKTYVNKGCNLLDPYLLTVLLSIPLNKLPWSIISGVSQYRKKWKGKNSEISPTTYSSTKTQERNQLPWTICLPVNSPK